MDRNGDVVGDGDGDGDGTVMVMVMVIMTGSIAYIQPHQLGNPNSGGDDISASSIGSVDHRAMWY